MTKQEPLTPSATDWNVEQVQNWLQEKAFSSTLQTSFRDEEINGLALSYLVKGSESEFLKVGNPLLPIRVGELIRLKHELNNLFETKKTIKDRALAVPIVSSEKRHLTKQEPSPTLSSNSSLAKLFKEQFVPPSVVQSFINRVIPKEIRFMSEEQKEEWASMITKLVVACVYMMFSIFCTSITMVNVHERVPKDYPPLPDIILDNVPLIPFAFYAAEIICIVLGAIFGVILILHKQRGIIFRRFLVIVGSVYLLRCLTMFITSMSVPGSHLTEECMRTRSMMTTPEEKMKKALEISMGFGMSVMGVKTCGDYMFSGHMSIITLLNYTIVEYSPKNLRGLHIFTWVLNCFGAFFILGAHEHYSIDVFIGFYISSRLFIYYHDMANMRHMMQSRHMDTTVYVPLFDYMEETVNGVIKNEFIFPSLMGKVHEEEEPSVPYHHSVLEEEE